MRSRPLEHPEPLDFQATLLISIASAALTIMWMRGHDLAFLGLDYRAWPQEPWRLLSACLLHLGYMHLAFNLYWLWRFGSVLEPIFGMPVMVGIYLFLAAGSSAVQWGLSGPGVGLSGVGYGLFGLAYALDRWHPSYRGILDARTTTLFIIWFFVCVVATVLDVLPIGNEAHGGGLVLGFTLGLALSPLPKWRLRGRVGLALATVFAALVCTVGRPYVNYSGMRAWELAYDGYLALQDGDTARAARLFEASIERDETSYAWGILASAYQRLGRTTEAMLAMQRSRELEAREQAAAAAAEAEPKGPRLFFPQPPRDDD